EADICAATSHVRFTPNSDRESDFPQTVMSALPPKADMCGANRNVCFVPKADMVGHLQRPNERDQLCVYFSNRTKQGWDFLHYC
ncbi:MAG: hypothetical protein WB041_02155, partial [Pseudolabrys sp.]